MRSNSSRRRAAQTTSLPLVVPAPTPLPGRVVPEMCVPCAHPFDSPEWTFSVDWEGTRALLHCDESGSYLQSETLADLGPIYPEIVNTGAMFAAEQIVLDGVITVLDSQGRPNLADCMRRRVLGADGLRSHPVVFLATDVLMYKGSDLTAWPLRRRLKLLPQFASPNQRIQAPETMTGEGSALAEAAALRDLPAILARRLDAPYRIGVASPDRLRLTLMDRSTCVVAGLRITAAATTLLLGEYFDGHLVAAGELSVDLEHPASGWLREFAQRWRATANPLEGGPATADIWLQPRLAVTFDHWGRRPGGGYQGPRLLALRDDVDPRFCQMREPVPPPSDGLPRAARVGLAVLAGLPLEMPAATES